MQYLVTGATGMIGSHLVEQLVSAGHDVTAFAWTEADPDPLPAEAEVVEGDVRDKDTLREPMTDIDGVFHLAAWYYVGPGPWNEARAEAVNVGGTRNVLELMDELAVPKGVYTSTIAVYHGTELDSIDETTKPPCPTTAVYDRTKWQAHFEIAEPMIDAGLPLVIVLPGGVFGSRDKAVGTVRGLFRSYLQQEMPIYPRHGVYAPFDYVEDTAQAHRGAMSAGTPGETYIISSEPRSLDDVLRCAEEITGIPVPRAVSPAWFRLFAGVMSIIERVVDPPVGFESETLRSLAGTHLPVDNSKACRELDLDHRPLREGLRAYLHWELDQLGLSSQP